MKKKAKKKKAVKKVAKQTIEKNENNFTENSFFVQAANHQFLQFKMGFEKFEADVKQILQLKPKKDRVFTKRTSRFETLKNRFK
ncbi:hypothetical protein U8527_09000 [Kordia algicida OT-1]|uniref:Uncharacterized protein n=1 Tax=Kordia algicida OT-1 TaxID=391587 RepID=A9DTX5_9FLAO|nr:hypothetical protein [Kordia algicida]EDP96236.1 hypothetical protein KAOT1_02467 [Kordia algicida OT-1]